LPLVTSADTGPADRPRFTVRAVGPHDFGAWLPLWQGYNAFYGRTDVTGDAITAITWQRLLDPAEPVHCLVAETVADDAGSVRLPGRQLLGIAHSIYHRNTGMVGPVCYLQDLFTAPEARGAGIGRALISSVYAAAHAAGCERVYWQTGHTNSAAMQLYDKVATRLDVYVYRHELD
jgi:GNAT superfamily N-acetyltransferase